MTPNESKSLQESESQNSSSVVSLADNKSELFQFQRIEDESFFLEGFKIAHSAHVMPKKFCRGRYHPYDTNPSNRLALSPDLHYCFDAKIPAFNLKYIGASELKNNDNRYQVRELNKVTLGLL